MAVEKKVSIIIRTKNEERWITTCLQAVFNQDYKNFEVVIVDNNSADKTVEKAKQFKVKIFNINEFLPGKSLNVGIKKSKGEYIVCLSAHCIPVNNKWLSNLLKNFNNPKIAGVYGRQEPMSFSSDFDKRDLLITFGLDKRVQEKDSFFHNANSMIRRDIWQKIPFDEKVSNIEDRVWAEQILKNGYKIVYDPEASVYHYHGIHQDRNPQRCFNVVRILESLQKDKVPKRDFLEIKHMNIIALIPVKGRLQYLNEVPLLKYTIDRAKQSKYIKKIIVSTDDPQTAKVAKKLGAEVPFLREQKYSQEYVDLEKVLQYTLNRLEEIKIFADLIVSLEVTYPFRPRGFIDSLVTQLVLKGMDSVVPAKQEFNSCWIEKDGEMKRIDEGFIPRKFKSPIYVGLKGLGCVTYPVFIREGKIFGTKVGIVEATDPHSSLEVRNKKGFVVAEKLMRNWWRHN